MHRPGGPRRCPHRSAAASASASDGGSAQRPRRTTAGPLTMTDSGPKPVTRATMLTRCDGIVDAPWDRGPPRTGRSGVRRMTPSPHEEQIVAEGGDGGGGGLAMAKAGMARTSATAPAGLGGVGRGQATARGVPAADGTRDRAKILHVDLDAFSSRPWSGADEPELRGRPVVVGGAGTRRPWAATPRRLPWPAPQSPNRAAAPSSPSRAGSSFAIPADSHLSVTARWIASATVPVTSSSNVGGETRTVVICPDGSQMITVNGRDGGAAPYPKRSARPRDHHHRQQLSRSARGRRPLLRRPSAADHPHSLQSLYRRCRGASPELLYETMIAPPVERIERRYSLDEIRYIRPCASECRASIDTINFEIGSWEIPPDQAAKLQAIADGSTGRFRKIHARCS